MKSFPSLVTLNDGRSYTAAQLRLEALLSDDPDALTKRVGIIAAVAEERTIHWSSRLGCWVVVDGSAAVRLLNAPEMSVRRHVSPVDRLPCGLRTHFRELSTFYDRWPLLIDDPDHRSYRAALQPLMKGVAAYGGAIRALSASLVRALPRAGAFDLLERYVRPLAAEVLSGFLALSNVPGSDVQRWADRLFGFLINREPTRDDAEAATESLVELGMAIERALQSDRLAPVVASANQAGLDRASLRDVMGSVLVDGFGPLAGSLGTVLANGLADQDLYREWSGREECDRAWIEATLRREPYFQYVARRTLVPISIGPVTIDAGSRVIFLLAGADASGRLLAFGYGPHACIGAALSRLTLAVAPVELARASGALSLASREISTRPTHIVCEPAALLVSRSGKDV